ncbi:ABC transporter, cobalt/nickel transport, ATP-binding protein isoform 1 [Galdieria sulphuraria]|uniref:Probable ATP-dependent transporter ycf16 n=1 Tax=Galdieria sulphuraria TaxID=130081 RepID=M2XY39_GALSU|nr:ABC transporter, cobalt/nickel transport, ATP-binding protein isoform 1 [Galdieria sulphuraria]EME28563.1 ABC transporter, cobalt/nickel transport, ATP-binding protein isoform 1 [Galdieria sulphuraria]|eukprot:XP_005705083.1 ABC transporter, cobalt/nickel transport, ATP-binding protein isoform 1 [Galdieria sulphuraria]
MTRSLFQATPLVIACSSAWNGKKCIAFRKCCSLKVTKKMRIAPSLVVLSQGELFQFPTHVEEEEGIFVEDVHFAWSKTRPVLKGISFQVPKGQFCMILGSNGSGKSTLCEVLYGSLLPHKGCIRTAQPIALIHQSPDDNLVFPTVDTEFTCCIRNETKQRKEELARSALHRIGLEHLYYSRVDSLSGGEKQRVAVASLLLLNPAVLILDEPTASMDASSREDFLYLVKALVSEKNMTVLWVTHLLEEQSYAERLLRCVCQIVTSLKLTIQGKNSIG